MNFKLAAILTFSVVISSQAFADMSAGLLYENSSSLLGTFSGSSYLLKTYSKTTIKNEVYSVNSLSFKGENSYENDVGNIRFQKMKIAIPVTKLKVEGYSKACNYQRTYYDFRTNDFKLIDSQYSYNLPSIDLSLEKADVYLNSNREAFILVNENLVKIGSVKAFAESKLNLNVKSNPELAEGYIDSHNPINDASEVVLSLSSEALPGVLQSECPDNFKKVIQKLSNSVKSVKRFEANSKVLIADTIPSEYKKGVCVNSTPADYKKKEFVKCYDANLLVDSTVRFVTADGVRDDNYSCGGYSRATNEMAYLNCNADENIEHIKQAEVELKEILSK